MERLRKKGYVSRKQVGGIFRYSSTESQADVLRDLVASFVSRSLSGSLSPFAAYLAEATEVTDEEIAELRSTLAQLEAQRELGR